MSKSDARLDVSNARFGAIEAMLVTALELLDLPSIKESL